MLIHRNGRGNASAGGNEIKDPAERGIFYSYVVPHPGVLAQNALDAVQRTTDDRGCTRRDFVGLELGGGKREERLTRRAIQDWAVVQRPQSGLQRGKERRIGISAGEIDQSVRYCRRHRRRQ